jgi:hypothetical protein
MKSWLRWILIVTGTVVVTLVLLGQHYVLSSAKLDKAIKTEIPLGTPKARVVTFIQTRHPVAYDDMGGTAKSKTARTRGEYGLSQRHRHNFRVFPDGKLLSYSTKVYLTFL